MTFPKPIRYDVDTWLCMRTDEVLPKAVIQRVHDTSGADVYLLFKWDLDPAKRVMVGRYASLKKANDLVLYDTPDKRPGLAPGMRPGARPESQPHGG